MSCCHFNSLVPQQLALLKNIEYSERPTCKGISHLCIEKEIFMTRLEELIYALATVIVRYHDIQDNIATKDKFVTALDLTMRKKNLMIAQ